jgi:hypothetical protein
MSCRGWAGIGVWVAAMAAGVGVLYDHQFDPAPVAEPGRPHLPPGSRPLLVMFVHPHCPCTPAALRGLATVVGGADCRAVIHVVGPAGADSPNGRLAAAIPGAEVLADADAAEARRFGARASGHVFLYAADGRLVFDGGITAGRGHDGDNPGRRALVARLAGSQTDHASARVFGCTLE